MRPGSPIQPNSRDTYQAQVESLLLDRIRDGTWPVDAKIPSERDLADDLKVSRTTVRNAVLALTTRGYFDRSVGQGTFVRRAVGPAPEARPGTGNLGYVVCKEKGVRRPIASEAFYFDVFLGIQGETEKAGRHTLFTYLDDYDAGELETFREFLGKVDGVVVEEGRNPRFLELLRTTGVASVLLAPTGALEGLDLVTTDLAAGTRKAIGYLQTLGHTTVAMVSGPPHLESARVRWQAWKETVGDERLAESGESWSAEAGHDAMVRLLDRAPELTAVFCANDLLALGALSALAGRSIKVPEDVSVVGFDDSELARHAVPPLTTMRIHTREMAQAATRRLVERVENPSLPPVRMEFPIDLVIRKSCKEVRRDR